MAEERTIQIQDDSGNVYYPQTKSSAVFMSDGKSIDSHLGDATALKTSAKDSFVNAINEVFQSGTNVKSNTISAVNSKGGNISASATWDDVINAIKAIAKGQGNAVESQVLGGATFSNSDGKLRTGSMANNGAVSGTITNQGQSISIPEGYTKGGSINANFENLTPDNVKENINIGGITGTLEGKQDLSDYFPHFPSCTVDIIDGEGLYGYSYTEDRVIHLYDKSGTLLKTIDYSGGDNNYGYQVVCVTRNYILWVMVGGTKYAIADKNGTCLKYGLNTPNPMRAACIKDNTIYFLCFNPDTKNINCIIVDFNNTILYASETIATGVIDSTYFMIPFKAGVLVFFRIGGYHYLSYIKSDGTVIKLYDQVTVSTNAGYYSNLGLNFLRAGFFMS